MRAVGTVTGLDPRSLEALAALLESSGVDIVIDKVFPLDESANAVAHMLGHHARGKVALAV